MKPDLILHIGSPKTGTSSIQKTLITNKDALYKNGYHYLECLRWHDGAHHELAFSVRGLAYNDKSKKFDDCISEIKNELSLLDVSEKLKVVISSEILFYDISSSVDEFKKLFELFENIRVIACLRDPIDYLTSLYKQMVRDPNDRLSIRPWRFFETRRKAICYQDIVNSYKKQACSVDVYEYQSDMSDLFFGEVLGLKDYKKDKLLANETLDGVALKIKLRANEIFDNYEKNKTLIPKIVKYVEGASFKNGKMYIFKENEVEEILRYFSTSNDELNFLISSKKREDFNFFPVSDEVFEDFVSTV